VVISTAAVIWIRRAQARSSAEHLHAGAAVREKSRQEAASTSAESDAAELAEQCGAYTSGMNRVGRDRFIECVLATMGTGFRFCPWDVSATPCTNLGRRERDRDDGDPDLETE
jgi:hypothetical protein